MAFAIIHLTDIHYRGKESNKITDKVEALKKACASPVANQSTVIIAITGDIAYSGKQEEYDGVMDIFIELESYLKKEKEATVHFIMVPGNHDCDFSKNDTLRESILKNIKPSDNIDKSIIQAVRKPQDQYDTFSEVYDCNLQDNIIAKKNVVCGNKNITFLLINTSWMSTKEEIPGKIIIPEDVLKDYNTKDSNLVITLMHHPNNWLNPDSSISLEKYLRRYTDIILVGHEHRTDRYKVSSESWSLEKMYGKELQNLDDENDSSFAVYCIDEQFAFVNIYEYSYNKNNNSYERLNEEIEKISRNKIEQKDFLLPLQSTINETKDLGVFLVHPNIEDIILPQLYCWPDLLEHNLTKNVINEIVISTDILDILLKNKIAIICGDNLAGKTSLGKMIFNELIDKEECCLFGSISDFKSGISNGITRNVESLFIRQYGIEKIESFRQLPKERKVIIIDDFDKVEFKKEVQLKLLNELEKTFGSVIILSGSLFEAKLLCSTYENEFTINIMLYSIKNMGNNKRYEMIRKWHTLGLNSDFEDHILEQKIQNNVDNINLFLGKMSPFIPATPLVVLHALQNMDVSSLSSFEGSQYGFLYESIITKSLASVTDRYKTRGLMNIHLNIISKLAFYMLVNKKTSFTKEELDKIIIDFEADKKVKIEAENLLGYFNESRIIHSDTPNMYKFKYPYIFYYFSGRYIAYNLNNEEVNDRIIYMSSRLYNEYYGNIMIFVCHFANNSSIIDTILLNAYDYLSSSNVFDFDKNYSFFDRAEKIINKLLVSRNIDEENVETRKKERFAKMDKKGIQDGNIKQLDEEIDDEVTERLIAEVTASIKTIDVLGQILQNYPGDINGDKKIEIIDEIYKLGMRLIQSFINLFTQLEDDILKFSIDEAKKEQDNRTIGELRLASSNLFSVILSGFIRSIIDRIAISMSNELLLPAIEESYNNQNTIAAKLIYVDIRFNCLRQPNVEYAIDLYNNLEKSNNKFALCILQSIVSYYLSFNDCDFRTRSRICEKLNLNSKELLLHSKRKDI